jgi:hypothetical protein
MIISKSTIPTPTSFLAAEHTYSTNPRMNYFIWTEKLLYAGYGPLR